MAKAKDLKKSIENIKKMQAEAPAIKVADQAKVAKSLRQVTNDKYVKELEKRDAERKQTPAVVVTKKVVTKAKGKDVVEAVPVQIRQPLQKTPGWSARPLSNGFGVIPRKKRQRA